MKTRRRNQESIGLFLGDRRYIQIDVWSREEDKLVCYRCFRVMPDDKYCVQSKETYYEPFDLAQTRSAEKRFLELLFEESPESRCVLLETLEEAIAEHRANFEWAER